jgi:hypothetical protein
MLPHGGKWYEINKTDLPWTSGVCMGVTPL